MNVSDLVLHVGYPKAASTWLQTCVFTAEFGFQNPWPTADNAPIEHFVLTPRPSFDAAKVRNDFLSVCRDDGGAPVISHEALVGGPVLGRYFGYQAAERLAETFPEARVVMFFRAQEAYAYSGWCEHVRRGGLTSIEAFVGDEGVAPGYRPFCPPEFLKFDELIGFYRDLFGRDRVLALPMEALGGDGAVRQLATFLDNEKILEAKTARVYRSFKGGTTRILRQLNRFSPYDPTQRADRGFLMRQAARIDRRAPKGWQEKCRKEDEEKIAALLKGRFAESNRRLQDLTPVDLSQFAYQL